MKAFYLKGLSTTKEELEIIRQKFAKKGVELIPLVDTYSKIYKYSKEDLVVYLRNKIKEYDVTDINLVCHSMGCNIGLLLSNYLDNISHIAFISPEFMPITKEEQSRIIPSTKSSTYQRNKQNPSIENIKGAILFAKSKSWVREELRSFLHNRYDTSVLYSKGDINVSRNVIHKMSSFGNIEEYEIDTNNHNPLLEDTDAVSLIASQLNDIKIIKL